MTGIKALAAHLDLSIGTVSRALNAKPDVNEQTRLRVLEAARELGYRPNQSGRSLRNGRTNTIGIVLETGNASTLGGDTFFMHLIDAMHETIIARGLDLVILPCRSADDPIEFLKRLVSRRAVDALVITATRRQDARIALLAEQDVPFLTLGRSETPGSYPWIDLDFDGVARESIAILAGLGHKRIAIAAARRDVNLARIFIDGYRAGLAEHGLPFDESLVLRASPSENGGLQVAEELLAMPDRPTAVILGQELMAIGVYTRLAQAGLQVGRDLSVIGFRKNAQLRFLQPTLASFDFDIRALGQAIGEAIVSLTESGPRIEPAHQIWPLTYVPAESVASPSGPSR